MRLFVMGRQNHLLRLVATWLWFGDLSEIENLVLGFMINSSGCTI